MDNHQPPPSQPLASSRMGLRGAGGGGGEIVEVQGGHIVRSTGRKDRHSKVCTAKGPRDRRVRLSAHTAIQFYDVQDRLGYDRPSKAVDWLINKAKAAIDELAVLPAWHLTAAPGGGGQVHKTDDSEEPDHPAENSVGPGKKPVEVDEPPVHTGYEPRFMSPQGMDSDAAIADTMKSFFPMVAATTSSSNPFQSYSPDLLSRTSSAQAQDLRLSLQSFQDPILLHHNSAQASEQSLFSVSAGPLSFDAGPSSSWSEHQQEMSRYWASPAGGGGGFFFSSGLQPVMAAAPMLGHGQSQVQLFTQRGPLQSSNSPQVRAWADSAAMSEHPLPPMSPHSSSVIGFNSGGFSGFRVPARIYGEEEHDPVGNKPSAGSSASRH